MSQQQREALDQLMRNGPVDIDGDPKEQRELFRQMLTARPLPDDVTTTPGKLGEVPTLTIEAGEARSGTTLLWFPVGGTSWARLPPPPDCPLRLRAVPAPESYPSTIGWRQSTRTRPRSRMPKARTERCCGPASIRQALRLSVSPLEPAGRRGNGRAVRRRAATAGVCRTVLSMGRPHPEREEDD